MRLLFNGTGEMCCFFSIIWRKYVICPMFVGRMVIVETAGRQRGVIFLFWFQGKISLEIFCGFHWKKEHGKSNYHTISIFIATSYFPDFTKEIFINVTLPKTPWCSQAANVFKVVHLLLFSLGIHYQSISGDKLTFPLLYISLVLAVK